jgi:hypothetical protein
MNLWNLIRRFFSGVDLEEMADRVAAEAGPEVWKRVERRAVDLGVSEARGYIRARARSIVHQHVKAALAAGNVAADHHSALLELSLDRVVKQGVTQALEASRRRLNERRRAA